MRVYVLISVLRVQVKNCLTAFQKNDGSTTTNPAAHQLKSIPTLLVFDYRVGRRRRLGQRIRFRIAVQLSGDLESLSSNHALSTDWCHICTKTRATHIAEQLQLDARILLHPRQRTESWVIVPNPRGHDRPAHDDEEWVDDRTEGWRRRRRSDRRQDRVTRCRTRS